MSAEPVEILIVEDSPTQALQLEGFLTSAGYRVQVAADGAAALEIIRTRPPNLIVADVLLPVVDGYELCRRVKADASLRGILVILLTILSGPEDVIQGIQCGADNFLIKPCDQQKLLAGARQKSYLR
jgi:DNA-binding response OmpR family regulator